MRKERLTIEEVKEFKPSMDNRMVVECDDGNFESNCKKIEIVGVYGDRYSHIDGDDWFSTSPKAALTHYPSQKPEAKIEVLYECMDNYGSLCICNSENKRYTFDNHVSGPKFHNKGLMVRTGRTFKLNVDTWKLIQDV